MAGITVALIPLQDGLDPSYNLPPSGWFVIGRKVHCGVVVPEAHAFVSGEHCKVHKEDNSSQVLVEDLSSNGTWVNGKRIGKGNQQLARIGDEISLAKPTRRGGSFRFRLAEGLPQQHGDAGKTKCEPEGSGPVGEVAEVPTEDAEQASAAVAKPPASVSVWPNGQVPEALAADARPLASVSVWPAVQAGLDSSPLPDGAGALQEDAQALGSRSSPEAVGNVVGQPQQLEPREAPLLANLAIPSSAIAQPAVAEASARNPAFPAACDIQVNCAANDRPGEGPLRTAFGELGRGRETVAHPTSRAQEEFAETSAARPLDTRQEEVVDRPGSRECIGTTGGFRIGNATALTRSNASIAAECQELQAHLERIRIESADLERSRPAEAEAAAKERMECQELRLELESETRCMQQVEVEESALQKQVEETSEHQQRLRSEIQVALARNAQLEEECAATNAETSRSEANAQTARESIRSRALSLRSLREMVWEQSTRVRERLSKLEQTVSQVSGSPCGTGDAVEPTIRLAPAEDTSNPMRADEENEQQRRLRADVEAARVRNASLQEECAEAAAERQRVLNCERVAQRRLENRDVALSTLRGAIREHAETVRERLALLERALLEAQAQAQKHVDDPMDVNDVGAADEASRPTLVTRSRSCDDVVQIGAGNAVVDGSRNNGASSLHIASSSADDEGATQDPEAAARAPGGDAAGVSGTWGATRLTGEPHAKRHRGPAHPIECAEVRDHLVCVGGIVS